MEDKAKYGVSYIAADPKEIRFDGNENEPWNVRMFRKIANDMVELYARKNKDYGDSFTKSVEKYGMISALTRISDKFNRIENLILNGEGEVKDETLIDSLTDLASYSVMTVIALRDKKIAPIDFENDK